MNVKSFRIQIYLVSFSVNNNLLDFIYLFSQLGNVNYFLVHFPLIFIIEREALWNQWSRILAPTCQTLNVENDSPSHNKHLLILMLKGVLRPAFSTIEFLKKVSTCILPNLIFQPIFAISNPLELLLFIFTCYLKWEIFQFLSSVLCQQCSPRSYFGSRQNNDHLKMSTV